MLFSRNSKKEYIAPERWYLRLGFELENQVSRKGLKVWRISALIQFFIYFILSIIIGAILYKNDLNWQYNLITVALLLVYFILFVYLFPKIKWHRLRYEVREAEIEIQRGLFIVKRTLIPMVRVQHVDTTQGPLLRMHGVADLTISTAATVHIIPAIAMDEADELRRRISTLARMAKDDV